MAIMHKSTFKCVGASHTVTSKPQLPDSLDKWEFPQPSNKMTKVDKFENPTLVKMPQEQKEMVKPALFFTTRKL